MTELNSPKYKHGSFYLSNSKKSISLKIRISDVPHTLKQLFNFSWMHQFTAGRIDRKINNAMASLASSGLILQGFNFRTSAMMLLIINAPQLL